MPPMLMTTLFAIILSLIAPHSNIALPFAKGERPAPIETAIVAVDKN